jgi:hypothetical protein
LLLARIPECAEAGVRRERSSATRPEQVARSLQQHFRRAPVRKTLDCAALIVRVDEFAVELTMLLPGKFSNRFHAAAGVRPCVEQCDGGTRTGKFVGRR